MSQAPTSVWLHGGSSAGQQSDIPICPSQQRHHDKMQSYREQKPCSRTLLGRFEFQIQSTTSPRSDNTV